MDTVNKVIVGIDEQVIELENADKQAFLLDQQMRIGEIELHETELTKAKTALLVRLGITADEAKILLE